MKILFLCGSLEPGRDGVGDYTRRLAGELIRKGNSIAIAAINDGKLVSTSEDFQNDGKTKIAVLRIPANLTDKKKGNLLTGWVNDFSPDLISLQYVPYSFSKYGTPLSLGLFLRKLQRNNFWHLMVHEPYLGTDAKGIKNQIIKYLQVLSLHQLKKSLKPILFQTSNPQYQKRLKNIGIDSRVLSLFGNIMIGEPNIEVLNKERFKKNSLTGIYFGSAPQLEQHNLFANEIMDYCQLKQAKLQLIFCGNLGALGDKFMTTIQKTCDKQELKILSLGTLPVEELSKLFFSSDFGISRVSPLLLGKSGIAITMLEHGLPLWVPLGKEQRISEHFDFRPELCFQNLSELGYSVFRSTPENRLSHIATKFISELNEMLEGKRFREAKPNFTP